ncbi:uncharacterized protein K441DRAFT_654356 [Cenococcum geophilum 1.58]|uniref:uncharacterized protein n=1 Tax=Cenococcum geophilum 1.58 TaxID=794803 RepID=UPI00358E7E3F|nr:hypothetical protein K441DRAFT_654356 [Cenococcum geophilum 1.58]
MVFELCILLDLYYHSPSNDRYPSKCEEWDSGRIKYGDCRHGYHDYHPWLYDHHYRWG